MDLFHRNDKAEVPPMVPTVQVQGEEVIIDRNDNERPERREERKKLPKTKWY